MSGGTGMAGDLIPDKTATALGLSASPESITFECFGLSGGDLNDEVLITTENFGTDQIVLRRPILMCEAGSMGNGSLPDPRILACYAVDRGQDPDDDAELFTALDNGDAVEVRKSTVMCVERHEGDCALGLQQLRRPLVMMNRLPPGSASASGRAML